jgi:hypothetical protein
MLDFPGVLKSVRVITHSNCVQAVSFLNNQKVSLQSSVVNETSYMDVADKRKAYPVVIGRGPVKNGRAISDGDL